MDVLIWRDDQGRVVALTPPAGMTADEAKADGDLVPQDRLSFVVDNGDLPAAPVHLWRLSDDGKVTASDDPLGYRARRAAEYPPIGDQLDALWKGGADAEAMKAAIVAIKTKYPKPNGGGGGK